MKDANFIFEDAFTNQLNSILTGCSVCDGSLCLQNRFEVVMFPDYLLFNNDVNNAEKCSFNSKIEISRKDGKIVKYELSAVIVYSKQRAHFMIYFKDG